MGNTILLADKSITIQKIVELTFADEDYVIRCVNDGHSALETIPQLQPDIILADIGLPGLSGYDLCNTLRTDSSYSTFSKIPVILLAGIYETMDEERARQVEERVKSVGANAYLSKPFDSQLLTEKVKEFLAAAASSAEDTASSTYDTLTSGMVTQKLDRPEENTASFSREQEPYPPPDDTEKTMMIQGPPGFTSSMFAEKPPFEEHSSEEDMIGTSTVKISGPDLEAARAAYARISREEGVPTSAGSEEDTSSFEIESTMAMKMNSADIVGSTEVMAGGEEPFGNVFEESTARWRLSPIAEEENPFGLPEQEIPIPIIQEPAPDESVLESKTVSEPVLSFEIEKVEAELDTASFQRAEYEEAAADMDSASPVPESLEYPGAPEIETASIDLSAQEVSVTPDNSEFDDTWPGRKIPVAEEPAYIAEPEAEELLVSDSSKMSVPEAMEEFDNKQPEFVEPVIDSQIEPDHSSEVPGEIMTPATSSGMPMEISEELIERIVEKVIARLSERVVSEIVWQVVPDLAEKMIRRELEKIQTGDE